MRRRDVLKLFAGMMTFVLLPINTLAAGLNQKWNKAAFEATKLADASKGLSISAETPSKDRCGTSGWQIQRVTGKRCD